MEIGDLVTFKKEIWSNFYGPNYAIHMDYDYGIVVRIADYVATPGVFEVTYVDVHWFKKGRLYRSCIVKDLIKLK